VIQISSPVQGPSSPQETGYRQENAVVESLTGDSSVFKGAQKKNKLWVFAKLLQGLQVKLKKGEAVSVPSENSFGIEEPSLNNPGKTGKKTVEPKTASQKASLTKNVKKAPFGMEILNGEVLETDFLDVSARENGLEPEETGSGNLLFPELPKKIDDFTFTNVSLSGGTEPEKSNLALDISEKTDSAHGREQPGDTAKKRQNAGFLNASFREAEKEFPGRQALSEKAGSNFVSSFAPNGAEKENASPSETRGRRSKEKLNIEVRDLRTGEGQGVASASAEKSVSLKEAIESNLRPLSKIEVEIPVELDLNKGSADGKAGDSSIMGRTFEDALAAQLRGNLSADIVRDAAVIVRNGGEGTIRLSLRPASLGDVKIRLEMTENKISGHIILESSEALRAFERELPVLEKAFRDSGFSETNLEMFLASDDSSNGRNFGSQQESQERDFLVQALAATRYETESEQSAINRTDGGGNDGMFLYASPGRIPVNLLV
jgi:flagellar hook-length control protein FliK